MGQDFKLSCVGPAQSFSGCCNKDDVSWAASSEGLTGAGGFAQCIWPLVGGLNPIPLGYWQEASVPHHMAFPTGCLSVLKTEWLTPHRVSIREKKHGGSSSTFYNQSLKSYAIISTLSDSLDGPQPAHIQGEGN